VSRLLNEAAERATKLLTEQRDKLDRLASELEKQEMLDETEVVEIIGPATPRRSGEATADAAASQAARDVKPQ
jgi:ATP-dependent Zn protease